MNYSVNLTQNITQPTTLSYEDKLFILNLRYYIYGFVVLPLSIIGLGLNSFTILVLMHPKMRYFSTNAYLTTLSLANIFCLINFLFLYSIRYLVAYDAFKASTQTTSVDHSHSYDSFICFIYGIVHPVFMTFQLYSIYLTCAVTVDRWIYITFPLKVDTICSMRNTFKAIAGIFAFCVIYNLPRWFEIESFKTINTYNNTIYLARMTDIGKHPVFDQVMRRYGYIIFVYGLPFFILLVVNIGIVKKLIETKRRKRDLLGGINNVNSQLLLENHHSQSNGNGKNTATSTNGKNQAPPNGGGHRESNVLSRTKSTSTSKKSVNNLRSSLASSIKLDPKITIMVMAIVFAFFLCQFPYLIVNIIYSTHQESKWFYISKIVCDILTVLNYCVNFLIYCFFGQNFRELAKFLLCHPSLHPYNKTNLLRVLAAKRKQHVPGAASTYARQSSVHKNNLITTQVSVQLEN